MGRFLVPATSLALLAPGCTPPAPPTTPPVPMVVPADWLQGSLGNPGLVVLHVGTDSSFAAGHIPGARPLSLQRFAPEVEGLGTEMPDAGEFRELLEEAGVSADSRLVIYSATHPPQFAARLYLTLDHFGLATQASLLDGGLRAWEAEGRPLATDPVAHERGVLPELSPRGGVLVDRTFVAARLHDGGARIVDARDPPFWSGEQHLQARAARPGRIPGAGNLPFRSLVGEDGRFLPEAELRALFDAAGIEPGEPLVAYCHVGQQASLVTLVARMLGHAVGLYDGSWEEWSAHPELPAEQDQEE